MKTIRKSYAILSLIALLLVSTLLFVGCKDENNNPADTTADTTTDTVVGTSGDTVAATAPDSASGDTTPVESETTAPAVGDETIADAGAYLDKLLAYESEFTNDKTVMDMTMDMHMAVDGMEQDISMTMTTTEITAGADKHIICDSMGETYEILYVDGMLYVSYFGELIKCPATPEQVDEVSGMLGGSDSEDDSPDLNDLLTGSKADDIFGTITAVKKSDGTTVVSAKGFNKASADKLAPEMMPLLLSLGMVGGNITDEDYESKTEEELDALLIADTAKVLREMSEDAFSITVTADSEDTPIVVSFTISLSSTMEVDGSTVKTDMTIKADATHTVGGQVVKAPANAADYAEGTWDDYFGTPSPEDLGLVPDANGVYTLSDDPDTRAEQTWCIYSSIDLFADATFHVKGAVELLEREDDGSTVVTIYTHDASGNLDYISSVDGMFAEGKADQLIAAIESGNTYNLVGTFGLIEIEGEDFLVFIVDAVTPVAAEI